MFAISLPFPLRKNRIVFSFLRMLGRAYKQCARDRVPVYFLSSLSLSLSFLFPPPVLSLFLLTLPLPSLPLSFSPQAYVFKHGGMYKRRGDTGESGVSTSKPQTAPFPVAKRKRRWQETLHVYQVKRKAAPLPPPPPSTASPTPPPHSQYHPTLLFPLPTSALCPHSYYTTTTKQHNTLAPPESEEKKAPLTRIFFFTATNRNERRH